MNIVNPSNPFQMPPCLQRADSQQRRRERFKKGFIAAVVALVILLVGLLIEGCMSEKATTPAQNVAQNTQTTSVAGRLPPRQQEALVAQAPQTTGVPENWTHPPMEQPPQPIAQPKLNTISRTAPPVATGKAASTTQSETLYVVKSGDSLTRIAKAHGTTVKALKAANGLENDRIVVGAKLKIPTA
jgi:2',3'-cyclic-nucleotide 2'-phosphodiesterase/3'-nucleotidase